MSVDSTPEGFILGIGQVLSGNMRIIKNEVKNIGRGDRATFTLRQYISPEEAELIPVSGDPWFNFFSLQVKIVGAEFEPSLLKLPGNISRDGLVS